MDSRETRVAKNEAVYRAVNRAIESASEEAGEHLGDTIEVLCECGQPGCESLISLGIADYDRIHGERDRFVVAPGHFDAELERVVEETDEYLAVDKYGRAAAVAEATERREGTT